MREDHSEALAFLETWEEVEVALRDDEVLEVHPSQVVVVVVVVEELQHHSAAGTDECPEHCPRVTPAPPLSAPWSASPPGST